MSWSVYVTAMSIKCLTQMIIFGVFLLSISACTINSIKSHVTEFVIEQEIAALNTEADLSIVKTMLLEKISKLEKMLEDDKSNDFLHVYAAQAYYSYAFSFLEDIDKSRALIFYNKAFQNASAVLEKQGISSEVLQGKSSILQNKISLLDKSLVGALYWTAVSWAKLIEIQQPDLLLFLRLHKTKILMEQVKVFDKTYYHAGPDLFFAVYYARLPVFFGGDSVLAEKYFTRVRQFNNNRLLIVDYLQARYMGSWWDIDDRKQHDRLLKFVINAPDNLYPEQALMNAVAKQKAKFLLENNTDWGVDLQSYKDFFSWLYIMDSYLNNLLKI